MNTNFGYSFWVALKTGFTVRTKSEAWRHFSYFFSHETNTVQLLAKRNHIIQNLINIFYLLLSATNQKLSTRTGTMYGITAMSYFFFFMKLRFTQIDRHICCIVYSCGKSTVAFWLVNIIVMKTSLTLRWRDKLCVMWTNNGDVSSNCVEDEFENILHSFFVGKALSMASCGGK